MDITSAIMEFMNNGKLLGEVNITVIVVIPKVQNPVSASQFRPISCYNAI